MVPPPAPPVPSATLLLVRDGRAGLEVFMVERHHASDFAAGALVFPGGKLDPADADPALRATSTGAEELDPAALALRAAAVREAFEECGVLLAHPAAGREPVSGARLAGIEARWREALRLDRAGLPELLRAEGLVLACARLVPFAHWITPEGVPKRFDTHFFLAEAPDDQVALHDGRELVDSVWIRPGEAAADALADRRPIIFPTLLNLRRLARSRSVAEALARARAEPVVTVLPVLVRTAAGEPTLRIPPEAGYELDEAVLAHALRG